MSHLVLLGDSIFDNTAYVGGGPDVISQVSAGLPAGWQATLRAVDGSMVRDVAAQLKRLPEDASHLVVSAGGNDALGHAGILERSARSAAEVLEMLATVSSGFEDDYRRMIAAVLACGLPTALCTIYYPRFPDPVMQRLAVAALSVFNDCITRAASAAGLPLLDLRLICDETADYANPIEPSSRGGAKIAAAIVRLLAEHDFRRGRTEVFI